MSAPELATTVDVAIFGGGVAGLWLLNRLHREGYQALLLEADRLGAGQTRYSMPGQGNRSIMLLTKPAAERPGDRSHLTGYLSYDEGRTWQAGRVISVGSGGYSDVTVTPEKTILVLYENRLDATTPKGMLLARFNLPWLLATSP